MRYYLGTEFDGYGGPLISMALVREDGRSCYYIFAPPQDSDLDPWVRENVMPILTHCPVIAVMWDEREAAQSLADFLAGDPDPVIVTDWPADIRYFCDLIEFPGGMMASIALTGPLKFELHRVDAYPTTLPGAVQHNAWWDAMALRHLLQGGHDV